MRFLFSVSSTAILLSVVMSPLSAIAAPVTVDFSAIPLDTNQLGPTVQFSQDGYEFWFDRGIARTTATGVGPIEVGTPTLFIYRPDAENFQLDQFQFYRTNAGGSSVDPVAPKNTQLQFSGFSATATGNASSSNDGSGDGLGLQGSGTAVASHDFGGSFGAAGTLQTAAASGTNQIPASLLNTDFQLLQIDFTADADADFYSLASLTLDNTGGGGGGTPIPEPSTYGLLAIGCLVALRHRRRQAKQA